MATNVHKFCASLLTSESSQCCKYIQLIAVWTDKVHPFCLFFQVTEVENDVMSPVQEDEGPNTVSQLAKKVCEH